MNHRFAPAIAAILLLSGAPGAAAGPPFPIEIHGLKCTSPVAFCGPAEAGLDAIRVVHPADAQAGGEKMSLTAVAFPKDSGMSDAELLDYVGSTFLASSAPGKPVERTLLGKKVSGRAIEKKIPAPSLAELYVATRKSGDKVVLGFVFSPDFAKEADKVIAAIAATLKE
jgi:hypothetical protein